MELNEAELLLLDFLKDIKGVINFKAIQGRTLPFESPKQKFLDLVTVWVNTSSNKIIDIRFATNQHIVSKPNSYLLMSLPDPKSSNKLLAFHKYLMDDLKFDNSGQLHHNLINGMFRYTKRRNYSGLENTMTQCSLQMNCKLSSIELINLAELLND